MPKELKGLTVLCLYILWRDLWFQFDVFWLLFHEFYNYLRWTKVFFQFSLPCRSILSIRCVAETLASAKRRLQHCWFSQFLFKTTNSSASLINCYRLYFKAHIQHSISVSRSIRFFSRFISIKEGISKFRSVRFMKEFQG